MLIAYFVIWFLIFSCYVFNILVFIDYKQTNGLESKDIVFYMIFLLLAPLVIIIQIISFLFKKLWK
jgi:hypothetical protein